MLAREDLARLASLPENLALEIDGLTLTTVTGGVRIVVTDYHSDPCHITASQLKQISLRLTDNDAGKPESIALDWKRRIRQPPDKSAMGPALTQKNWNLPAGLSVGDYLVARVRGGLDVFVTGYHARPITLTPTNLTTLGLSAFRVPLN